MGPNLAFGKIIASKGQSKVNTHGVQWNIKYKKTFYPFFGT